MINTDREIQFLPYQIYTSQVKCRRMTKCKRPTAFSGTYQLSSAASAHCRINTGSRRPKAGLKACPGQVSPATVRLLSVSPTKQLSHTHTTGEGRGLSVHTTRGAPSPAFVTLKPANGAPLSTSFICEKQRSCLCTSRNSSLVCPS